MLIHCNESPLPISGNCYGAYVGHIVSEVSEFFLFCFLFCFTRRGSPSSSCEVATGWGGISSLRLGTWPPAHVALLPVPTAVPLSCPPAASVLLLVVPHPAGLPAAGQTWHREDTSPQAPHLQEHKSPFLLSTT